MDAVVVVGAAVDVRQSQRRSDHCGGKHKQYIPHMRLRGTGASMKAMEFGKIRRAMRNRAR